MLELSALEATDKNDDGWLLPVVTLPVEHKGLVEFIHNLVRVSWKFFASSGNDGCKGGSESEGGWKK